MRREWLLGGGAATTALALILISGLVRIDEVEFVEPAPELAPELAAEIEPIDVPKTEGPLLLVPLEPDPAHDWLRARSLELVDEYLAAADPNSVVGRWHEQASAEAQLIFVSQNGQRFITLAGARADCAAVDGMLREADDPLVGVPGLCARWVTQTRELLADRGIKRSARGFLRERGVDTSVRVAMVYAAWKRTGRGPEDFRLVRSTPVPVYPQSKFSVARRLALDAAMRSLGVGPYTDTPIQLVTALLRW